MKKTASIVGVALLALPALIVGCGHRHVASPEAAKRGAVPVPTTTQPAATDGGFDTAVEIAIGMLAEEMTNSARGEYGDAALSAYVSDIGKKIAKQSERPDLPWHFQVLDTEDIGAHALPGGRVTITRGILAFLGSEAEVAAVLAHEVAHVAFRHSHSKWSPAVAVAEIGDTADERERLRDADQERQADTVGARYLSSAGYDPRAMVDALSAVERAASYALRVQEQRIKKKEGNKAKAKAAKSAFPELPLPDSDTFDPHPAPPARLARAAVAAGDGGGDKSGRDLGRDRYLSRIAGLEWGEGSGTPFLIKERYVIPGDLSFAIPRGYKGKSEAGVLQARVSTQEDAAALIALRLQKSFVSEALKASIGKGPHVTREILGRPALVARSTSASTKAARAAKKEPTTTTTTTTTTSCKSESKSTCTKSDDVLMAIVEGPTTVLVVAVNGSSPSGERVLDSFLASAERDTAERKRGSVVTIEHADAKARFGDFVRSRCPDTSLEIATALNGGKDALGEVALGEHVKCVRAR